MTGLRRALLATARSEWVAAIVKVVGKSPRHHGVVDRGYIRSRFFKHVLNTSGVVMPQ